MGSSGISAAAALLDPLCDILQDIAEAREEAAELVDLLKGRAAELALTLDADYPDLRSSIWLSEAAAQSAVQNLTPQMTENRKRVGSVPEYTQNLSLIALCESMSILKLQHHSMFGEMSLLQAIQDSACV